MGNVDSYKTHHKINEIKKDIKSINDDIKQSDISNNKKKSFKKKIYNHFRNKSQPTLKNTKSNEIENNLTKISTKLTNIYNNITYINDIPSKHILLDYFKDCLTSNSQKISIILFGMDNNTINTIVNKLSWSSYDNILIKISKLIKQYINIFNNEITGNLKLFKCDNDIFCNQFIILSINNNDKINKEFCRCCLTDIQRSVKLFFDVICLYSSFVNIDMSVVDINNVDHIGLFREYYQKACYLLDVNASYCINNEFPLNRITGDTKDYNIKKAGNRIIRELHSYITVFCDDTNTKPINLKDKISIEYRIKKLLYEYIHFGGDINYINKNNNKSIASYAISTNNENIIREVLKYNIDGDIQNSKNESLLIESLKNENISELICILISEKTKYPNIPDINNKTAVFYAMIRQFWRLLNILRDKSGLSYQGYFLTCFNNDKIGLFKDMLCPIFKNDFNINLDESNKNVLHYCSINNSINIIKYLFLKYNYIKNIINKKDNNGYTPLMYAAKYNNVEIAAILLNFGANFKMDSLSMYIAQNKKHKAMINLFEKYYNKNNNVDDYSDKENDYGCKKVKLNKKICYSPSLSSSKHSDSFIKFESESEYEYESEEESNGITDEDNDDRSSQTKIIKNEKSFEEKTVSSLSQWNPNIV